MSDEQNIERPAGMPVPTETVGGPSAEDMAVMRRVAAEKGKNGDIYAIWISHLMMRDENRPVVLDLPSIEDSAGIEKAQSAIIAAAAAGHLSPRDALSFSAIVENRRRAISVRDLERRLLVVERANTDREKQRWRR